jgi:cation transport protein ChaC
MPLTCEDLENDALRKQYENLRDQVPLVPAAQFDASLESALSGWDDAQDLWVFAYGSLIWNPLIHFVEQRRALLRGFHRRFCLQSRGARGTLERPGLVCPLADDASGDEHGNLPRQFVDPLPEMRAVSELVFR